MTSDQTLRAVPGGSELIEWFGGVPHFHDGELLSIELRNPGLSRLRIHAWRMTDEVDEDGYYVLDRHAVVTLVLDEVTHVELFGFHEPGIILDLAILEVEDGYQVEWGSSCGVEGMLRARRLRIELQPGKPVTSSGQH